MTKEEAEKFADDVNSERVDVWCPVSRDFCKIACEVYVKAVAREAGDDDWKVTGGVCEFHAMKGI